MTSYRRIERFLDEVMQRAALRDREHARRITDATLRVLGQRLARCEVDAIAEHLPRSLAAALSKHGFEGSFDTHELYARVAALVPGLDIGDACEQVQAVCRVVGRAVTGDARRLLERLPDELSALFDGRVVAPPRRTAPPPQRVSRRLCDTEVPPRAHADSIARARNPRAGRKLSSGHRAHTLAEGTPRPEVSP